MSDQLKLELSLPMIDSKWHAQNRWKRRNRDKTKEQHHRYNIKHAIEHRERSRKWALANPDKIKAAAKRCYYKNRDRYLSDSRTRTKRLRLDVITNLGGKCACCGDTTFEFLTVDHINGGGKQHRKQYSGHSIYVIIRQEGYPTDKYRVLCMDCNFSLGAWGYCPHERERQQKLGVAG